MRNGQVRNARDFGVLQLMLRPHGYRWRFVAVGGAVRDHGDAQCN